MPEVPIQIGGRTFNVACQEGEEHFLHAAASLLDNEAKKRPTFSALVVFSLGVILGRYLK